MTSAYPVLCRRGFCKGWHNGRTSLLLPARNKNVRGCNETFGFAAKKTG